jgi:hypothetical protein
MALIELSGAVSKDELSSRVRQRRIVDQNRRVGAQDCRAAQRL